MTGATNADSVLKLLISVGYLAHLVNSGWVVAQGLSVSIALKSYPAWDEKGSGVDQHEKMVSARQGKYIDTSAFVLSKLFSAQTHNSSLPGEPTTWPSAEPFKNDHHWRAPNFKRLISDVLKLTWFI
jgi:hypothetical protein